MGDYYQTWRAGKVVRMHTMPQVHRESTGEHTWGVLLMAVRFYPKVRAEFLKAIVLHDAPEIATGDIPANVKRESTDLTTALDKKEAEWLETNFLDMPELSADEKNLLLVFDKLDFCVSCIHEMRIGNLNSARYYKRSFGYAQEAFYAITPGTPEADAANNALNEIAALQLNYCGHVDKEEYERGR